MRISDWSSDVCSSDLVYIRGLFGCFDQIGRQQIVGRAISAEFGMEGYYHRHERHYVYWRRLSDQCVGIVTILHGRLHQTELGRAQCRGRACQYESSSGVGGSLKQKT